MKTLKFVLALFLLFGCVSIACRAETAEEMLSACRPITHAKVSDGKVEMPLDFDSGSCWGAFGMLHGFLWVVDGNSKPLLNWCVPKDATRTELIAVFVKYTENHPDQYGQDFQLVVINSILQTYPCKGSNK